MAITDNERKVLAAIKHNYFAAGNFGDDAPWIWSDCINDSDKPSGIEGKTLSGICGSLATKGLVETDGHKRDACIRLTKAGIEASKDM